MRFIYFSLILIYPFLLFAISEDNTIVYKIWGVSMIAHFIIHSLIKIRKEKFNYHLTPFSKAGLLILTITFTSVLSNGLIVFEHYWLAIKFSIAFIIASVFYDYYNPKMNKKIFVVVLIYLIIFFIVAISRIASVNFNQLISLRDEIWFNKPVVFAFMYSALFFIFVLFSYIKARFIYLKYFFCIPLFLMGARSVILGLSISLVILVLNDFFKIKRIYINIILLFSFVIILFSYNIIFNEIATNEDVLKIIGSERNQNSEDDIDVNSFSSGRLEIIQRHINNFRFSHLLQGEGHVKPEIRYSNHNDLLDFFFIYGLIAALIYIRYYLLGIIFKLFLIKHLDRKLKNFSISLAIFIFIQGIFNPFLATQTSIYFFITIIIIQKYSKHLKFENLNRNIE